MYEFLRIKYVVLSSEAEEKKRNCQKVLVIKKNIYSDSAKTCRRCAHSNTFYNNEDHFFYT